MYRLPRKRASGYLDVGDGHRIYYECRGPKYGVPVVSLHGGPGGGSSPDHARYFPPGCNVILFDQRGCARSTPTGRLTANTPKHLVADIASLLDHLDIGRAIIYGNSWGSTLALLFAINHPERVSELIVSGVFLGTREEIDHIFKGGVARYAPEEYARFIAQIPQRNRRDPLAYLWRRIRAGDSDALRLFYEAEGPLLSLAPMRLSAPKGGKDLSIAPCYMAHHCFLSRDVILRNIERIADIPLTIVHGRYDLICPPESAWRLHESHPRSTLTWAVGGHMRSEGDFREKLLAVIRRVISRQR